MSEFSDLAPAAVTAVVPSVSTPFDAAQLKGAVDLSSCTYLELGPSNKATELVSSYIAKHVVPEDQRSWSVHVEKGGSGCGSGGCTMLDMVNKCGKDKERQANLTLGLGLYRFRWRDHSFVALNQRIGQPVGTQCGVDFYHSLVLFAQGVGSQEVLREFIEELVVQSEQTTVGTFKIFRWNVRYGYWRRDCTVMARPLDSVVLPKETKHKLLGDIADFVSEDSVRFYFEHGIPYKRAYLFYGVPGGGKTSLIQAIAGAYKRNLCYLQPTHPEMTDDSLKSAIQQAPSNSIIVLEDIDALFDKQRGKKCSQSPLTFSGLLNALDGCGSPQGQIFILTTNFREQLDAALIRNGRVDLHVEFCHTTHEQMATLFAQFYPSAAELAGEFADALTAKLGERRISMAALQHYFIRCRKRSAQEALQHVGEIIEDLEEKKAMKDADADAAPAAAPAEAPEAAAPPAEATPAAPTAPAVPPIHIHLHKDA